MAVPTVSKTFEDGCLLLADEKNDNSHLTARYSCSIGRNYLVDYYAFHRWVTRNPSPFLARGRPAHFIYPHPVKSIPHIPYTLRHRDATLT